MKSFHSCEMAFSVSDLEKYCQAGMFHCSNSVLRNGVAALLGGDIQLWKSDLIYEFFYYFIFLIQKISV